MKPIQIVLIAVALVAALGAGFMMLRLSNQPAQVITQKAAPIPRVEMEGVLVAGQDIPMGSALGNERLIWQDWPKKNLR